MLRITNNHDSFLDFLGSRGFRLVLGHSNSNNK